MKKCLAFYCFFSFISTPDPPAKPEPIYESWFAFTGLRAPKVSVIRECKPVQPAPHQERLRLMFCDRAGKYLEPKLPERTTWFCLKASGTKERCEDILKQNQQNRRVILWNMW